MPNPGVANQVINLLITANNGSTVVQELIAEPGNRFRFFTNAQNWQCWHSGFSQMHKIGNIGIIANLYCNKFAVSFFFLQHIMLVNMKIDIRVDVIEFILFQ